MQLSRQLSPLLTFQRFVDGKVEPNIRTDAQHGGRDTAIKAPTPEAPFFLQDCPEGMSSVAVLPSTAFSLWRVRIR